MDNLGEVKQPLEGRLVRLIKKPQVRHFQVQGIGTKVPLGNGLQTRTELYLGLCCSPEASYRPAKLSRAIFRGDQYHHVDIKPLKPPGQTGSECTDGKYLHQYHEKNSGFAPLPERVQAQVCSLHICVCIRSRWIKRFLVLLGPALGGIYGAVRHISSTVVRLHADWDFKACRKYRFIDFQGLTMLHNITQNKLFHFPPVKKIAVFTVMATSHCCHGITPFSSMAVWSLHSAPAAVETRSAKLVWTSLEAQQKPVRPGLTHMKQTDLPAENTLLN